MTFIQNSPLVSICCTAFNHENYIRDCIEGFLMQKTNFQIEIIIHDDASTDNTAQIIKEYEGKHPDLFVTIYQTENQYSQGIKPWPNFVFPRARGKYIALCEGDDYWTDPLKLQKQVDFLEGNEDCSLSHHSFNVVDKNGKTIQVKKHIKKKTNLEDYLSQKNVYAPQTCSIVFKKDILDLEKIEKIKYFGDTTLYVLLLLNGKFSYYHEEIMAAYRIHKNGAWSGANELGKKIHTAKTLESIVELTAKKKHNYNVVFGLSAVLYSIILLQENKKDERLKTKRKLQGLIFPVRLIRLNDIFSFKFLKGYFKHTGRILFSFFK